MIYCIDSSAWLDGWVRDYPQDVFPTLWEKLAQRVADGVLKCSEEVYVELKKKDDGIYDWLKARKEVVVPIDEPIQAIVSELLERYPRLVDTHRNRSQADPVRNRNGRDLAGSSSHGRETSRQFRRAKDPGRVRCAKDSLDRFSCDAARVGMEILET